jgi:hypothetical protein
LGGCPFAVWAIVAAVGIKIGYDCGRRDGREEMETIAMDFGDAEQCSESRSAPHVFIVLMSARALSRMRGR